MSWTPAKREIDAVLALNGAERYAYWVKHAADQESVWCLWHGEGWALAGDAVGHQHVPVWPHPAYASLCTVGEWAEYEPRAITIDDWLERWTPGMEKDGRLVAVFPTPADQGVSVEPGRMSRDLREELERYE